MKRAAMIFLWMLFFADRAESAWLLWRHSLVTQRVEGMPRGISPGGDVDKWELLNAVDLRKECIAALKVEHRKSYDTLTSVYPKEPVSQSIVADGISGSVSAGAERSGSATSKSSQLYYVYTFWCLPAEVDPNIIRSTGERNKLPK
ncbi:MAG TPA: hypothetical protein VGA27_00160 [Candidatus Binatia bacterium]